MIRTKTEKDIDSSNGISAIVYHDELDSLRTNMIDPKTSQLIKVRAFRIGSFIKEEKNGRNEYKLIREVTCIFRESTFLSMWGNMTFNDFKNQNAQLMMQQIAWVNAKEWDGTEIMKPIKFWDSDLNDLEIVSGDEND